MRVVAGELPEYIYTPFNTGSGRLEIRWVRASEETGIRATAQYYSNCLCTCAYFMGFSLLTYLSLTFVHYLQIGHNQIWFFDFFYFFIDK